MSSTSQQRRTPSSAANQNMKGDGQTATTTAVGSAGLRAYSDPVIYRDDRVLRTLLRKERRYVPQGIASSPTGDTPSLIKGMQNEVKAHMRKEVADWMLEVCEDQQAQPEVFCLAMNYFDRFLGLCSIGRSQLQLLGAVCLLVAWKVREHQQLPAVRLVEYSDYNLTLIDIMEWEVLLLSKLDWDMSAVIASDFVEHIIQRVCRLHSKGNNDNSDATLDPDVVRAHSEALITMCSAHHSFSGLSPSLVAAACVITTISPFLDCDAESTSSPNLDTILDAVEQFALIDKASVRDVMSRVEDLMRASLPPSPAPSPPPPHSQDKDDETTGQGEGAKEEEEQTPTKVLEVARRQQQQD